MLDLQMANSELYYSGGTEVRGLQDVGDVSVDKYITWIEA
jgi:hypothetical protein